MEHLNATASRRWSSHRNEVQPLSNRTTCRDLPGHFHLIVTGAYKFIEQICDHAAMIGDHADTLADLGFAVTGRKIDMTVFFGQRVNLRLRIFADISISFQSM